MSNSVTNYLQTLAERFGQGWNRFWFTPGDPLNLSVIRLIVGALAFYVVLTFSFDLERLLGPDGLLPVPMVRTLAEMSRETAEGTWRFSYLDYVQGTEDLWFAHVASLTVLALFTLGVFTRVTSILALLVTLSYIQRAPMVTGILEPVLAMLQFYLCLGPAGAELSFDRWRERRRAEPGANSNGPARFSYAATIATRLIQIHVTLIYAMMALGKLYSETWWNGTAVWWLLARPDSRFVDLTWMHEYVFNAWTHAIVMFELAFAVLVWNRLARPLMIALSFVVWALVALASSQVGFALAMSAANLAFVSPEWLRSLRGRRASRDAVSAPAAVGAGSRAVG